MSALSLTQQLQALADSHKQTLILIQELQRFPNSSLFAENADDKRLEVGTEIHQNLAEHEDALEFLRQEAEDNADTKRHKRDLTLANERDHITATIARLNEDLKAARGAFRKAQLQAKRNADANKRKEREELFASRLTDDKQLPAKRSGQEKLTQDELALNAAEDVTRSLRRAHELLSSGLSQSQFAQQTLDESSEALKQLDQSYSGTTDLLKNSRGLVTQLMKSQKSDTWFLISSTYIMAGTLAWLIFRRLLYGPLWWFLWKPLQFLWWISLTSLGALSFGDSNSSTTSTVVSISTPTDGIPTMQPGIPRSVQLPAKGGGWGNRANEPAHSNTPETVEQVSKIIDEAVDGIAPKVSEPSEQPRNTKKRMMEVDIEQDRLKDEL